MKSRILALTLLTCWLTLPAIAQNDAAYGLGLSDADWKKSLGTPTAFGRDEWLYRGQFYTRSWARKDAPRGRDWKEYVDDNYLVKEITIVWGRKNRVSLAKARAEATKLLPADAKRISKVRRNGSRFYQYYSSAFLATRLFPGLAGDDYCVTPWGYGVGKFKVEYFFARGRVFQVAIDVGEPHQTSLDVCKRA